ncbi:MAG: PepSY domain-containing protein [Phyllobacteriaceae bacterium]|nr:PepSY domain-containing protein [Phyllobacteriaceae bacterium]
MRRTVLVLLLSLLAAPAFADKGGGDDDDDAHEARRRGDALPLPVILEKVRHITGKRIVDIETEKKRGVLLYGIYYIDAKGRRREIYVDSRTGVVVESKEDD